MIKKELLDILKANGNDSVIDTLTCIAKTLHEYAGLVVNISAAQKVADGSFNYYSCDGGQNALGQTFSDHFSTWREQWEDFAQATEDSNAESDFPLLGPYDANHTAKERKGVLRKYFHDALEWKIRHEDRVKTRLPWNKLISDTASFIAPGCLPSGFRLRDPEDLRTAEMAELWKHMHHRQRPGRVLGLEFTDKFIELFKKRGKDSSHRAMNILDRDHTAPQVAGNLEMLKDLVPIKSEDDLVHLPATTQHPAVDSGTVPSEGNVELTTKNNLLANQTTGSVIPVDIDRTSVVENQDASPSRVSEALPEPATYHGKGTALPIMKNAAASKQSEHAAVHADAEDAGSVLIEFRIQSQVDSDVAILSREGSVQPMNVDGVALDLTDEIATQSVTEAMDATPSEPIKAPSQVESDGISRLKYLKSLSADMKWISALDVLEKMKYEDPTETPAVDAPSWIVWSWNSTALPASVLADTTHAASVASWLRGRPHLQQVSRSSAENVFLAIGLTIHNIAGEDKKLWLDVAGSVSADIKKTAQYKIMLDADIPAGPLSEGSDSLGKRKRAPSPVVATVEVADGACGRCGQIPKHLKMHKRICTYMVAHFKFLSEPIIRDPVSNLFSCPYDDFLNKDYDKIRKHVNSCHMPEGYKAS